MPVTRRSPRQQLSPQSPVLPSEALTFPQGRAHPDRSGGPQLQLQALGLSSTAPAPTESPKKKNPRRGLVKTWRATTYFCVTVQIRHIFCCGFVPEMAGTGSGNFPLENSHMHLRLHRNFEVLSRPRRFSTPRRGRFASAIGCSVSKTRRFPRALSRLGLAYVGSWRHPARGALGATGEELQPLPDGRGHLARAPLRCQRGTRAARGSAAQR